MNRHEIRRNALIGKKINNLTVNDIEQREYRGKKIFYAICTCSCGTKTSCLVSIIFSQKIVGCHGCANKRRNDKERSRMLMKKFGQLIVKSISHKERNYAVCECSCGREVIFRLDHVKNGKKTSCGYHPGSLSEKEKESLDELLVRSNTKKNIRSGKHGLYGTRIYRIWTNMITRCTKETARDYNSYGGAGIFVCDEWKEFAQFKDDMITGYIEHARIYGEKNTTIDRIDNYMGYSKDNFRWATQKVQANNHKKI